MVVGLEPQEANDRLIMFQVLIVKLEDKMCCSTLCLTIYFNIIIKMNILI